MVGDAGGLDQAYRDNAGDDGAHGVTRPTLLAVLGDVMRFKGLFVNEFGKQNGSLTFTSRSRSEENFTMITDYACPRSGHPPTWGLVCREHYWLQSGSLPRRL